MPAACATDSSNEALRPSSPQPLRAARLTRSTSASTGAEMSSNASSAVSRTGAASPPVTTATPAFTSPASLSSPPSPSGTYESPTKNRAPQRAVRSASASPLAGAGTQIFDAQEVQARSAEHAVPKIWIGPAHINLGHAIALKNDMAGAQREFAINLRAGGRWAGNEQAHISRSCAIEVRSDKQAQMEGWHTLALLA